MTGIRRFNPPREELERLYQTHSMVEIADIYGVGQTVIHKRIHEHGIELKGVGKGGHRKKTGKIFTPEHCANLSKAKKGRHVGENNPNYKGGSVLLVCQNPHCPLPDRKFIAKHAEKWRTHCSHSCRSKHLCQGEDHPKWREHYDRTPKKCALPDCDVVFGPDDCANIVVFSKQQFCCKEHADIGGFRYKGEAHPSYKPDARRRSERGKQGWWTRRVKSRDHNTCQDCGARDRPLHAHHLKPFVDFPELRWDISNGITLCDICHHKRHGHDISPAPVERISKRGVRQRRWEGNCDWCGAFLSKPMSDAKEKQHHFCSKKCMGRFKAKSHETRP